MQCQYFLKISIKLLEQMKGISTTSPEVIRRHQANTSKTKIAHQFPKTKRFSNPNPECKAAFYPYQTHSSSRKAGFGYGSRSDFTKTLTCSPASTKYIHKSFVEEEKAKGKTFALNRESMPNRSYLIPQLQKVPGPGSYENPIPPKMTISYSMRIRTKDFNGEKLSYKKTPAPNAYKEVEMLPNSGRFKLSKFGDTKLCKINSGSARFKEQKRLSPGPNHYGTIDNLSEKGKYILSRRKGFGTRTIDKQKRQAFTDIQKRKKLFNPAPGEYQKPSDFGTYGDANYYKLLHSTIR